MMNKLVAVCLAYACFAVSATAQQSETPKITPGKVLEILKQNPAKYGLDATDIQGARISDFYIDRTGGISHAYVQQYYKGMPIINAMLGLHFDRNGREVHAANSMLHLAGTTTAQAPAGYSLSTLADQALITGGLPAGKIFTKVDPASRPAFADDQALYYECAYFSNGILETCLNFVFFNITTSDHWNMIISRDGRLIDKINWTVHCKLEHNHAKPDPGQASAPGIDGTQHTQKNMKTMGKELGQYSALPFPTESPLHGKADTFSTAYDTLASPFGWHDLNGSDGAEYSITAGNNVYASVDDNGTNQPGYSPDGGSGLDFRFPFNISESNPLNYQDFSVTNLFVANNMMHDISYLYGFDEVSGNFQENNYGKGGTETDGVNADAQDGGGTNNANFSTPPDGVNPRMQMYVWEAGGGLTLRINTPQKTTYNVGKAMFGGNLSSIPLDAKLIMVTDGVGSASQACGSITNKTAISGNIAGIRRGACLFTNKVYNAQLAGAIAVVIFDTSTANQVISMSGTDSRITIPAVFLKYDDANDLTEMINGGPITASMYDSSLFDPKTDSDLDLGVIAHEYTHGISNRLTCGPNNTSALNNAEQMGEGWSDFVGLAYTVRAGDVGSTPRGIGMWLIGEKKNGGGIRDLPYSTNMAINSHVYNDIKSNGGVHYVGEVWASMLWDLYWKMVEKHGFSADHHGTSGNNECIQLVFDGMKLQKCNPGFVDGRDAILKADSIRNGGANSEIIWRTFARRGLGWSALQGSSFSVLDGTQAFDLPAWLGISEPSIQQARLYPNPTSGELVIEAMNSLRIDKVEILGLDGKILKTVYGTAASLKFSIQDLKTGLYLARIYSNDGVSSLKFIRE